MKSNYIVLRTNASVRRDVWSRPTVAASTVVDPDLRAEVVNIERKQLVQLARDSGVHAIAPPMPMRLIEPVSTEPVATPAAGPVVWGVKAVRADTSPLTGEGMVVAVLDTGINADHPAFAGVELIQKDFTGEGDGDRHGHGTHCAGTIFGRDVNGTRIGVARGVRKALIGKVIGQNGGSSEQIVSAVLWAVDQGAHVISMSLGIDFAGAVEQMIKFEKLPPTLAAARALEGYRANTRLFDKLSALIDARGSFTAHSTLIVAAAGNESQREVRPDFEVSVSPPAAAEGVISVAALGEASDGLSVANFSNTDASLSAPGVDVISANVKGGLQTMSGTSMATPHVAGVAALWGEYLLKRNSFDSFRLVGKLSGEATTAGLRDGFDPFDIGAGLVQAPQEA